MPKTASTPEAQVRLDPKTRKWLEEQWLPEVRAVPDRRRPIKRLLIGITVGPLLLVVGHVGYLIVTKAQPGLFDSAILTSMIGIAVGSIQFLGKLQSCDDEIPNIALAVGLGDRLLLLKCIGQLGCYSRFRRHLDLLKNALG